MPYEFNTPVAVITVESNDYPRPKLVNGQWVVSASSVRKEPNKIILYNPTTRLTTPVTPYTVSPDYYKQVKEYEDTLAKMQAEQDEVRRLYADTTNFKQVNSFADVITAGDERFAQQLDRMFATGQPADVFSWIGDKGKAFGELLKNMLIDPIMKEDISFLDKAAMLFNNALVNLSETMDYFTLTSVVKAQLIGAVEGKSFAERNKDTIAVFGDVYGSGRKQLDWNEQTGSAIGNFIVNTILEVFSDPTTWISLGTSSAIKRMARPQVSFVIQKSFDDVGIAVTKNQADDIAKGVIRSFIYGDNSLAEAISKAHIGKGLKKQATSTQVEMFYYALKKNTSLLTEIPNLHLLKSVRGASEGIQKLASKTAGYTSAMGWGYHAIKGALKGGLEVLPYAVSKINSAIKKVDFDNITLKNLPEHLSIAEEELNILRDVVDLTDRFPQQTVAQATHAFQEMKYIELKNIISKIKNTPSAKVLSELNAWAVKAGFTDIFDVLENLLRVKSAVPSDLHKMVYEIGNTVTQLFDNAIIETINPVVAVLNKDVLSKMVPTEYVGIIEQLSELKKLGITDTEFANTIYDDSITALRSMLALFEHSEQRGVNTYIQQYEVLKEFNMFTYDPRETIKQTIFDRQTNSYRTIDIPVLDLDIATADQLIEALHALDLTGIGKTASDTMQGYILDVLNMLKAWNDDTLSITMVKKANEALAFIKHALQEYNKYALDSTPDLVNIAIANTHMPVIDVLRHNLVEFIEKKTRVSRTPINEAFLFTDTIVGKAADSTAGHVVLNGLNRLVENKGLPPEYVEKMYTQLINYDLNVKLDADLPAVKDAFAHLTSVAEYLQDMDTGSYFIRELGFYEAIDDWAANGFTIDFGDKLLDTIDQIIYSMRNRVSEDTLGLITNIQLLRDDIQELVNIGNQTIEQRIKMTQELMSSRLYKVKLSDIQALSLLLNTEYVQEVLTNIRYGTDIGQLFDALADPSLSSDLAEAVGHIQSLSKSVYVANQTINRIRNSNLPDVWKDGLYDTLAGYARMHIDELGSPEHVAYSWLTKAKTFIDNINHAHAPRFNELNHTGDTLAAAEYLYKAIFAPLSIEPPVGRVAVVSDYWEGIGDELLKDGDNYFNVVYSASQTGFKSGTIYDFSFVLPNGDSMKYVDNSMREAVLQTMDNQTARKLYGKSKKEVLDDMQDIIRREANNPNVKVFDTTEEFAEALFDLFRGIKSTARDNKLTPRLIGFNTAADSFGTDQILSRFMTMNRLNTHIQYSDVEFKNLYSIKTFDAAQFLRVKYEGAVTITNDMLAEVTEIVRDTKVYLEEANAYTEYAKGYLIPDFNTTVKASFREVLAALDNTIEILEYQARRPRALLPDDFHNITQAQFNLLTNAFSLNQLHGFRAELSNVIQNIGATLLNIKQSNSALGQYILIQEAIAKYTGERNVMNILNKYFVQPGGVPALSYKKMYDPDVFTEWFGTYLPNVEDLYTFTKMQDIADRLQRIRKKIKHPLLLTELDSAQMKQTIEVLKSQFIMLPNYRYSEWAKEVMMLEPGNNPINNYVIAKYLWDNIKKVSDVNTLEAVSEAIKKEAPGSILPLYYIQFPDETVMFNAPLYIAGIDVLHSELIKNSNYIMQLTQEIQEVTNVRERAETLYDALFLDQRIREERGLHLPSLRIKERFIKAYTGFINSVQAEFDKAFAEYIADLPVLAGSLERLEASKMYTARVEKIISELDALSFNSAQRRANFIMTLTPDSYAKFLYKFSQGVQVFDMGAEIFQDAPGLLGTFMRTLKDGEQFGIKYVEDIKNKQMFVYLDKNIVDLEKMLETTKDFVLDAPKLSDSLSGSALQQAYYKFADMMDEVFDGSYSLSMHRTMDNARFNELLDYIPTTVKDNMIPLEHLSENDLIEGLFSQTIVGDYSSGVGTIFSIYSSNIVTNTAAGFNVAFNRMRGKDMYITLIFNQENSLKAWLKGVSRLRKVTQDEVVDAITKNNYVVAELKDGKVLPIDIRKPLEYRRALETGAALLDYHTYMRSVEVLNISYNSSKLSKIVTKYLGAIKLGQLMSFGWVLRNIMDSTIKGWVQAGLDPMYVVSSFTRTRKIMAQYDATYAAVFKATNGNLSPKNVAEFFAKNTDELLLDEDLFRKLLTFYSSSSSVPTAAQLALDKDLVTKLYNRVKGNDSITRGHVKRALEIFKETAHTDSPFKNAYASLRNVYSDDIATTLILLRKYVPEKELKKARVQPLVDKLVTSNYIMRANNNVESFIRTHTVLYHSVYNDGSITDALKAVDLSQFNRSRDSKAVRMMEHLLPFSTFQMDNFLFWEDAVKQGKGNLISLSENILNGMYDEEQLDIEELSRNMSLQYLYMSGNLILDDETGMSLKINDSLHSVLELITSPVKVISDMLNVPLDVMRTLVQAVLADEEAYAKSSFGKVKPISQWEKEDYTDEMIQLIPLVGVIYQRYTTAWDRYQMSDMILPLIFPSIFGVTKLDSAGTTYHSRPIGFNWYNQTQEYKDTHRYVFGVSYVPSWMTKDPQTYANTLVRLQNMGYPREVALEMMQRGWYMKAPSYTLRHYSQPIKRPDRVYHKRTYVKPTHYKYVKNVKKPKTFIMKSSKPYTLSPDRFKFTERNHVVRRVYRPKLYNDRYTRTGVARETLIKWRGPNRSSRQLLRDRSAATRRRIQRILRQVRPL